jgi:hypothetical protein
LRLVGLAFSTGEQWIFEGRVRVSLMSARRSAKQFEKPARGRLLGGDVVVCDLVCGIV